jgi:hypothetical protein
MIPGVNVGIQVERVSWVQRKRIPRIKRIRVGISINTPVIG